MPWARSPISSARVSLIDLKLLKAASLAGLFGDGADLDRRSATGNPADCGRRPREQGCRHGGCCIRIWDRFGGSRQLLPKFDEEDFVLASNSAPRTRLLFSWNAPAH